MEFAGLWLLFAVVTAIVAQSRGRNGAGWFGLGLLFSFLALILVALLPSQKKAPTVVGGEVVTPATHVRCSSCAGWVPKLASRCMHCGAALTPDAAAKEAAAAAQIAGGLAKREDYEDRERVARWLAGDEQRH